MHPTPLWLRRAMAAVLAATLGSVAAMAQFAPGFVDPQPVLQAAGKAIGTDNLRCVTISGTGYAGAEHYVDRTQIDPQAGYFEKKFYGPERVLFDIAEHAWAGAEPLPTEIKEAAE